MAKKTHSLKIHPQYFEAIEAGRKTFELRKNDRGFQVGDIVLLDEYVPVTGSKPNCKKGYTGRNIMVRITYLLDARQYGLQENYCVWSFEIIN